ncbi:MAG: zinc-ribbon and DUF3426 domain-containing protein [Dokdonella sp.]
MYSQCPRCRTIFMVAPVDLAAARGDTVCGHCGSLFNALLTLSEFPPEPDELELSEHEHGQPAPALRLPVSGPLRAAVASFDPDANAMAQPADNIPAPPPQFTHAGRGSYSDARWWTIAALLSLTLVMELAWAQRDQWADDARVRPMLDRACASLGCALALRQDLSKLVLTSREVRPHPSVPDALLISATIRNDATFAQAFPAIRIRLSDLREEPVASRRFVASDYLVDSSDTRRGLAPQASAVLVFEVTDPGRDAVAFEFDLE